MKRRVGTLNVATGVFTSVREDQLDLRCYCCGEPIGTDVVALVTMQTNTDRVFVMLPDHANRTKNVHHEIVQRSAIAPFNPARNRT